MAASFLLLVWLAAAREPIAGAFIPLQPDRIAERITVASAVRLRVLPRTTAPEIARLPLGTILKVLDRSYVRDRMGRSEDFWYLVRTADGTSGWVFGGLTARFSKDQREEIYLDLAAERLQNRSLNFSEQVEFYKFLTRALEDVRTSEVKAELQLSQLLALSHSLRAIPFRSIRRGHQEPYVSWLNTHREHIVYSDPAGIWLLRSERFWELEKKYHSLPIGERIAWRAARYELPGECEGYVPCYLSTMSMREGTYLKLHPNGLHRDEALNRINNLLKYLNEDYRYRYIRDQMLSEMSRKERDEFKKEIDEIRKTLSKTTGSKKNLVLYRLSQLSRSIP